MSKNDLMVTEEKDMFTTAVKMYSSMSLETEEEKKAFFNTVNAPDYALNEKIGETIKVKDVFCEPVEMENAEGEVQMCPRVVLVDTKGKTYQSVSFGIYNALTKLMMVFGQPTWENGISIKIKQINKEGGKRVLTFEVV